ncbi:mitochondrial import inner membrane translocase subunit Tim10, partial [Gaertneriomyces semiglobifer]
EMVTTLFNNLVSACHQKCIPTNYHDSELNKGESVCIDRCVSKYFEVNVKVGQMMTSQANAA